MTAQETQPGQPAPKPAAAPPAQQAALTAPSPLTLSLILDSLRNLPALMPQAGSAEPRVMRPLSDATQSTPGAWLRHGSLRQDSTFFLRGLGGSVSNPYVTTYLDGVPQLHGYSANVELLDGEEASVLTGPQGTALPRNSLGGALWITSRRPSLTNFEGEMESTYGNYNLYEFRGRVTTPLIRDQLGFSFAGGYQERDGFSENPATGHDLDSRSASFGKAQFLWTPDPALEVRLIITGESARDGDDALNRLDALRRTSHQGSARDLEGYSNRDVLQPTLQITYHGEHFDLTSTTGYTWWETDRLVDQDRSAEFPLGYVSGPGPALRVRVDRSDTTFQQLRNRAEQHTFTQALRLSNPADTPVILSDSVKMAWHAGAVFHHTDHEQQTNLHQAEADLSTPPPGFFFPLDAQNINTATQMETTGITTYLQGTFTFRERLHLQTGLRWDYERQRFEGSQLLTALSIVGPIVPFAYYPLTIAATSRHLQSFTPEAALTFELTPDLLTYISFTGGRQPQTTFDYGNAWDDAHYDYNQARSWNYEWGLQGRVRQAPVSYSLALFYSDLRNLQVNTSDPTHSSSPYFNGGVSVGHADASAYGLETALAWSPLPCWQLYGQAALTQATYRRGSMETVFIERHSISGHQLAYSPDYTATVGTLFTWKLPHSLSLYAGADVQFIGPYHFDATNQAAQDAFTLTHFRLGIRHRNWFAEAFAQNAFDTEYVSSAHLYAENTYADTYYLGESGPPATFGLRVGLRF
ncbi:TonB-dependent receptor [Prosthecobacter fusiformis]|nr:TonB-dependent receptor [Prosthecobacter fusiformis]